MWLPVSDLGRVDGCFVWEAVVKVHFQYVNRAVLYSQSKQAYNNNKAGQVPLSRSVIGGMAIPDVGKAAISSKPRRAGNLRPRCPFRHDGGGSGTWLAHWHTETASEQIQPASQPASMPGLYLVRMMKLPPTRRTSCRLCGCGDDVRASYQIGTRAEGTAMVFHMTVS